MPLVYVGVGSNIRRDFHIKAGVAALSDHFGEIQCSPVYDTCSVGFEGDNFYNLVVCFDSDLEVDAIDAQLSAIEDLYQRKRTSGTKFCSRTLDLDLLLYDSKVINEGRICLPRSDVYQHAYVLKPLLDLAPDLVDPVSNRPFADIWAEIELNGVQNVRRLDI